MNMELVKYMLDGILLSLLCGVAGLLLWFHVRLNKLIESYGKMPQLSEVFGTNISEAKAGVQSLSDEIGSQVLEAGKTLQEINYVLDRAEKIMSQFDERLDTAKSRGMQPVQAMPKQQVTQSQTTRQNMEPPRSKKQAVLPHDVTPKVVRQKPAVQQKKSLIEESLTDRTLGGISKKVQKFRPKTINNSEKVVFKNTTPSVGVGAYGAASAVQKSGGGKTLAAEQEEGLIRALQERL